MQTCIHMYINIYKSRERERVKQINRKTTCKKHRNVILATGFLWLLPFLLGYWWPHSHGPYFNGGHTGRAEGITGHHGKSSYVW